MMSKLVTLIKSVIESLTIEDHLFHVCHQIFHRYRTTILVVTGTAMTAWLYNRLWVNRKFFPSMQLMQGKTVVITGGNTGIGFETAKDLIQRGARVIIVCRNMQKGNQALERLHTETHCEEKNLRLMQCDLCSFESIRNFAQMFINEEERLDVLICNAGVAWQPNELTKDGFNSTIQANYLGHFLLIHLLLDKLKSCRPSRIVCVSSMVHRRVRSIDWSDVFTQSNARHILTPYAVSKALQILSSYKLKQDLFDKGVDVFSLCPGWVWTSIDIPMREVLRFYVCVILYPILHLLKMVFAKTPKTGARTSIYCAVEPSLEHSTDFYFENCKATQTTPFCTDYARAETLWNLTIDKLGLK